uniref:Nucleoside diphosphate kinase n=1 Tax=Geotrypetes seraphini TaxID=260995 RepID=A0A6P8S785_GEOSA|nr:nucleoside diphosphate kinase 6 isoform X2 [Geotrypetes seraphini]
MSSLEKKGRACLSRGMRDGRTHERKPPSPLIMSQGNSARILQLTLAVIKPDAIAHPVIFKAVHEKILLNKFLIVRRRFFYQRLVEFMSSGPMRAYILAHEDAIQLWRSLMGPTKVYRARNTEPESIRGMYGLTDTRNTTHGSDSLESANREITFFFPEFCVSHWYQQDEPHFRMGAVSYDSERQIHAVHRT